MSSSKVPVMPTKLKYKLSVAFCLMSLVPMLTGLYIASRFITFPFSVSPEILSSITFAMFFSLAAVLLGFVVVKQLTNPILHVTEAAKNIARGNLETKMELHGSDEIEDLSKSLKIISQNAFELMQKVELLSLKDKLTDLYNTSYIRERLDEEVQRAIHSQCPCSFAYLKIDRFSDYVTAYGPATAEGILKSVAKIFSDNLSPFDRAARTATDEFAIVFPNRNKKKAIEMIEKIRKKVSDFFVGNGFEVELALTLCIGISENPIDGVLADGLYMKAQDRMKMAKSGGKLLEAFA